MEVVVSDAGLQAQPMQRLADKLTALVPPAVSSPVLPQPSPAVAAALARSAEQAKLAARRANRSRASFIGALLFLPYSLVALVLRLLIARVFFLDGQTRIEGPRLAYNIPGFDFHGIGFRGLDLSVIVPTQAKVSTVAALFDYLESAMLSTFLAYVLCFADFALPMMLVLGIGTRFVENVSRWHPTCAHCRRQVEGQFLRRRIDGPCKYQGTPFADRHLANGCAV